MAQEQTLREVVVRQQRGLIEDHNGETLALSVDVDSVRADPSKMEHPKAAARALAKVLELDALTLERRFEKGRFFAWVKRRVSPEEAAEVSALALPGVSLVRESRRFYPHRELGAQVLGMVGIDGEGLSGLELSLDHTLIGRPLSAAAVRDAHGHRLLQDDLLDGEGSSVARVTLTMDRSIQWITQKALGRAVRASNAVAGMAVVMEPSTGSILALASEPVFNPNDPGSAKRSARRNRTLTDIYEPGSTFKIFTLGAALEAGLYTPKSVIDCEGGAFALGGQVIHDSHPHGRLSLTEVLSKSSNIGAAKIALKLGPERFVATLESLGFGSKSELRLPGEQRGMLRRAEQISSLELGTISFGQGVAVTPMQLTTAVSAVANRGVMMSPFLVSEIHGGEGEQSEKREPRVKGRIFSEETAEALTKMMIEVTKRGGTAPLAAVPGFRVAGKTGTSQKVDPITRSYSVEKRIGSFVGFVPANAPRLVILVVIDEPQGVKYGGVVAAPAFREIALESLRYLGVPPTEPEELEALSREDRAVAKTEHAKAQEKQKALAMIRDAEENVASLAVAAAIPVPRGQTRVPDLRGLDASLASYRLVDAQLVPSLEGTGVVRAQVPAPGALVALGERVGLRLSPRELQ